MCYFGYTVYFRYTASVVLNLSFVCKDLNTLPLHISQSQLLNYWKEMVQSPLNNFSAGRNLK